MNITKKDMVALVETRNYQPLNTGCQNPHRGRERFIASCVRSLPKGVPEILPRARHSATKDRVHREAYHAVRRPVRDCRYFWRGWARGVSPA